jgi:pyridoxamine 5'-phosphate oxidase
VPTQGQGGAGDPIARFRRWYRVAERARIPLADAMALATADGAGRPSVRFVLLKRAAADGFVFFTDGRSRKGDDLRRRPRAALAFYWHATGKQVRVEGRVRAVSAEEADAYWETRPRASRLAALASTQSARLAGRGALLARWRALGRRYRGASVPRPAAWTGFRLVPEAIEFWTRGPHRLHHRERFERRRGRWTRRLLQP